MDYATWREEYGVTVTTGHSGGYHPLYVSFDRRPYPIGPFLEDDHRPDIIVSITPPDGDQRRSYVVRGWVRGDLADDPLLRRLAQGDTREFLGYVEIGVDRRRSYRVGRRETEEPAAIEAVAGYARKCIRRGAERDDEFPTWTEAIEEWRAKMEAGEPSYVWRRLAEEGAER